MLKETLIGFGGLFDMFGWFTVNDRMVYVNKYNKCKVWINQEYQKNIVGNQQRKQYNDIDKVKEIRNILKLFEKKTLMSKNAILFFKNVYQYESICEILEFVNKFVQQYQIIIVKQVKIHKTTKQPTTHLQQTKTKLFLTRSISINTNINNSINNPYNNNKSNHQSLSPIFSSPYKQYFSDQRLKNKSNLIISLQKKQSVIRLGSLKSIPKFIVSKKLQFQLQQQKRNKLNLFEQQKFKSQQKFNSQQKFKSCQQKLQCQCQQKKQKQISNFIIQKSKLKVYKSKSLNNFINVFNGMKIKKHEENNNKDNNNNKRDQNHYNYQVKQKIDFNNNQTKPLNYQKRGSFESNRSQFTYKSFKSLKQLTQKKNSPKVSFADQISSSLMQSNNNNTQSINNNNNDNNYNRLKLQRQPSISYEQVDPIHQQSYFLLGKSLFDPSNNQNNQNQQQLKFKLKLKSRIRKYSNNDNVIKINNVKQNNNDNEKNQYQYQYKQRNQNKINFHGIKIKSMKFLASNKNICYQNDEEYNDNDNNNDNQLNIQNQFLNKIPQYNNHSNNYTNNKQTQQHQSHNSYNKLEHIKTSSQTAVTFHISRSKKTLHNYHSSQQYFPKPSTIFSPSSDSKVSQLIQKNGWKLNISSLFDHNNNKNELKQSIKQLNYNNQYEEQERSKQLASTNDFLLLSKYGREIKSNNVSGIQINQIN